MRSVFAVLAIASALCVPRNVVEATAFSDDLDARICMKGLQHLADAEKARDASRRDAEVTALQDAIEQYDDCIASGQAKGSDTSVMEEHLIEAHVYLSDAFYRMARNDDAVTQAQLVFSELMSLCPRLEKPLSQHHSITDFDAHFYDEQLAPRFNLYGADAVRRVCGLSY
jgi:hypothetical protein